MRNPVLVSEAQQLLRDRESCQPEQLLAVGSRLAAAREYGTARDVLAAVREHPAAVPAERLAAAHAYVECTYQDAGLPAAARLDRALAVLDAADPLAAATDQRTLTLAGAIHEERWSAFARRAELERALGFYSRAAARGSEDDGAAGTAAARVLDLLACAEEEDARVAGVPPHRAHARRSEARDIRRRLLATVGVHAAAGGTSWTAAVTLMEANIGLGDTVAARAAARNAALLEVPGADRAAAGRRLAQLARLQPRPPAGEEVEQLLQYLLGDGFRGVQAALTGKVGLALSGGGFRASLYHIGVLARLAELDVLRHVEVLSCVSGGSIIGAHYYLELRRLLQSKPDADITRDDFVDIVRRIEHEFLAGVQRSVRVRIATSVVANLKMLFRPDYTRTHRAGELYEELLYARVPDGEGTAPRWLNGLYIRPLGESPAFHPVYDNWQRGVKVPMLVLNATSLNTGHVWQFTASFMGEPPEAADADIESNYRLRRLYYREAPERHRQIRLGHAVAASACVPGLFEPLTLAGLYEGITVRLVDGGVHDNQGVASLLEQNCDVVLVSDASGQMGTEDRPGEAPLAVPLRSNGILMARVREAQYIDLAARRRAGLLRGLMFIHLKKDLPPRSVSWIGAESRGEYAPQDGVTSYGISREVQRRVADLRTDLDTFADVEAYALMLSGYLMTRQELPRALPATPEEPATPVPWRFLDVRDAVGTAAPEPKLLRFLDVGRERFLKVWRLSWPLQAAAGAAALALLAWAGLLLPAVLAAAALLAAGALLRLIRQRKTLWQIGVAALVGTAGFLLALVHLLLFDPLYRGLGRVRAGYASGRPITGNTRDSSADASMNPSRMSRSSMAASASSRRTSD
jgi:predicted acylesterase/phospholipase RssA